MRKINVLEFVSLDGVIQAPGGPEEDTSGGFAYGGGVSPHSDPVSSAALRKQMDMPVCLFIGRRTFDIWAQFWPQQNDIWPAVNTATKYVASNTMTSHEWQPSVFLNGDIAEKITAIKQQDGPDLHVYGSANLAEKCGGAIPSNSRLFPRTKWACRSGSSGNPDHVLSIASSAS